MAAFFTPFRLGALAVSAAALLVVAGLTTQWNSTHKSSGPVGEADALRSATVQGIVPRGDVSAFPDQIQWDAVPGATAYEVIASEVDTNVIFDKTFTTTQLQTPDAIRKIVVPGKTVFLEVNAQDASGRFVAKSGKIRISIRPALPEGH